MLSQLTRGIEAAPPGHFYYPILEKYVTFKRTIESEPLTDDAVDIEQPQNTVMKILIGIMIFVFVGLPILAIALIGVLVMLGSSL